MGDSSDTHQRVQGESSRSWIRRFEDKAVVMLGGIVLAMIGWMWTNVSGQIADLQKASQTIQTTVAVHDTELNLVKKALGRIEDKLERAPWK